MYQNRLDQNRKPTDSAPTQEGCTKLVKWSLSIFWYFHFIVMLTKTYINRYKIISTVERQMTDVTPENWILQKKFSHLYVVVIQTNFQLLEGKIVIGLWYLARMCIYDVITKFNQSFNFVKTMATQIDLSTVDVYILCEPWSRRVWRV